jgi:hypothetical protein
MNEAAIKERIKVMAKEKTSRLMNAGNSCFLNVFLPGFRFPDFGINLFLKADCCYPNISQSAEKRLTWIS